jgi:ABC-type transporter Mla subunit MlaD
MKVYIREALKPAQLSVSFLAITVGITVLQVRPWAIETAKKSAATIDMAGRAMSNLDAASKSLKKASEDESKYLNTALPQLTGRVDGVLDNASAVLYGLRGTVRRMDAIADSANETLVSTRSDLDSLHGAIEQSRVSIQGLQPIEADADTLLKNPDIPKILTNAERTTANVAGTTKDVQGAVHAYLHPTWAQKVKNFFVNTGIEVAKFFF